MKTVAFLSHNKSLARLKPDIKALRHLGFHTITLCNNKDVKPDFIHENEFFEVDLGNTIAIVNILLRFNVVSLTTPSDHLLTTVVNICTQLGITPPCDMPTAEIFTDKFEHIKHASLNGLAGHVPRCISIQNKEDLDALFNTEIGPLFIKPAIGCGMRGIFKDREPDSYIFEYKGLRNSQELQHLLKEHNLVEQFILYCTDGVAAKYYYPTKPKALIQNFYHTNKSYTIQCTILDGKWYYNSTGQVFYWLQSSELEPGQRIDPMQDPRTRLTDGIKLCTEEVGYYHLSMIPEHIFPFYEKCVAYMQKTFNINNMGITFALHETLDGQFYMTDLNPRVGGQWIENHKFSQPEWYDKFWRAVMYKEKHTFSHEGPLGCVNPIFIDPGIVQSFVLPNDNDHLIITGRKDLYVGRNIPLLQSMNSREWNLKIYTCGFSLDEQISKVHVITKFIRDNIVYK
jgi:hypothetical protein